MNDDIERIIISIRNSDVHTIERILSDNPELINHTLDNNTTWLHKIGDYISWKNKNNLLKMLKIFIEPKKIDINAKNYNSTAAIYYFINRGRGDCVDYLINNGADIHNIHSYYTPLMSTLNIDDGYERYKMVEMLLERGVDVNQQNSMGQTILHHIFEGPPKYQNYNDIIELLFDYGIKISILDNNGITFMRGFHEILDFVIRGNYKRAIEFHEKTYEIISYNVMERLKKVLARDRIKKFLLKKIVLRPDSKYIQRLVNDF
jgi:ankyrin repeat protein